MASVSLLAWQRNTCLGSLELHCVFRRLSSNSQQLGLNGQCWQVSSEGRCRDTRGNISYGTLLGSGYRAVYIARQPFLVHRLVMFGFHGPPPNERAWQVHHKDGNKTNNRLDNLEYATRSQNMQHSFQNPFRMCGGPKRSKPVMWRAMGSEEWATCTSTKLAAERLGLDRSRVSKCCRNGSPLNGFELRYAEQEDNGEEQWRPMKDPRTGMDVPGRMVSSLGRLKTRDGRISEGYRTVRGYFTTCLHLNGFSEFRQVHRLVAAAFLPQAPSPHHTQVNHKDGDKGNNRVENLEFVTPAENIAHHFAIADQPACKSNAKPVESRPYRSTDKWTWHRSFRAAEAFLCIHRGGISNCVRGKQKQAGGYEFRLATPTTVQVLPGEEWRNVDVDAHIRDKMSRSWSWFMIYNGRVACHAWAQAPAESRPCRVNDHGTKLPVQHHLMCTSVPPYVGVFIL